MEPSIDRRSQLGPREFLHDYAKRSRPVVVTDVSEAWSALNLWTPESLARRFGSRQVVIDREPYAFDRFMDAVVNATPAAPAPYLRECDMTRFFPELLAEVEPGLAYFGPNWLEYQLLCVPGQSGMQQGFPELLIGSIGSRFPILHYDAMFVHAFVTQIHGDKEFILFAPEQGPHLYPNARFPNVSRVRIDEPDLEQFPLFAKAVSQRVTLKQGETLFVPAGWWHVTRMLSTSIAVSFNSVSSANWRLFKPELLKKLGWKRRLALTPLLPLVAARLLRSEAALL